LNTTDAAIAAEAARQAAHDLVTLQYAGLDFEPLCEPCRVMDHIDRPVARVFTCSTCDRIQLRCLHCADFFHEHPHTLRICAGCRVGGCFHLCFTIGPIGGHK
jgi:hypothetical protein